IIAGERRWHAAQLAGLSAVPVLVQDSDARSAFEMALIENIQRSDLNSIEEAGAYRRLVLDYGYTQQNVAALLGKSRSHIANQVRLLELPDDVQDLIRTNTLTPGHARQLIGRPDASRLARKIVQKNLTVRDVETMMAQARPSVKKAPSTDDRMVRELALSLEQRLSLPVQIKGLKRGKLVIHYEHFQDLERLITKLVS
ncbi:MAG: ParB/RepB/Spo0J family partition protein, partial [Pseudomonadota bacterium]